MNSKIKKSLLVFTAFLLASCGFKTSFERKLYSNRTYTFSFASLSDGENTKIDVSSLLDISDNQTFFSFNKSGTFEYKITPKTLSQIHKKGTYYFDEENVYLFPNNESEEVIQYKYNEMFYPFDAGPQYQALLLTFAYAVS